MAQDPSQLPRFSVGSLLGLPLGEAQTPADVAAAMATAPVIVPAALAGPPPGVQESPSWIVVDGNLGTAGAPAQFRPDGVEALSYSNPFTQNVERVWYDGKIVFALDVGEIDVDPAAVKVAQEYQIVYAVELDASGKLKGEPSIVEGQYNIYDSVPGMARYSPIWQFNYVVVPRGYAANSLRSARDCEASGYPIVRSHVFEN